MPAVFTDEKADLDLQIANQTGITFTTLMPNGDPLAGQPNANGADYNIAKRAIGAFPAGYDYRTHAIGAMIVFANPSTITALSRSCWFGIRNAVTGRYFWRLYTSSTYGGSNEPRMTFEYHDSNGNLHNDIVYNPGFAGTVGSGTGALWFIELQVQGSYGIGLVIRHVTASSETVVVNYNMAPIIYNVRTPDANEEIVASIPGGASGGGYMGKFAIASAPFTFAERSALAAAMFAV